MRGIDVVRVGARRPVRDVLDDLDVVAKAEVERQVRSLTRQSSWKKPASTYAFGNISARFGDERERLRDTGTGSAPPSGSR